MKAKLLLSMAAASAIAMSITGCGAGEAGEAGATGAPALVTSTTIATGDATCLNGGKEIKTGIDTNKNGTLDTDEVTSTVKVCNGVDGSTGATSALALVKTTEFFTDTHCALGGVKIEVGNDTDADNVLDDSEIIASQTRYVCNGEPTSKPTVEFKGMSAPATTADMNRTYSSAQVVITDSNGSKVHDLSYIKLYDVSTKVGNSTVEAGRLFDQNMTALTDPYNQPLIAETPDANSLLNVGGNLYMVSHLEYDWLLSDGSRANSNTEHNKTRAPMSMTLTTIDQNSTTGRLSAISQYPIDFSGVDGLWIPCFGSQTPWNTHLGSEEDYDLYFTASVASASSRARTTNGLAAMTSLYFNDEKQANMYHYGFIPEVTVEADGNTSVVKHYSMGRGTWEQALVLDDNKTAFYGDDGTNVGLYMYVADSENNLTAGNLYAAKWNQISSENGGDATLTWFHLGHATDSQIRTLIDANITFEDIFDYNTTVDSTNYAQAQAAGFTPIVAGHSGIEWLRLKAGQEQAAAFLETRRYSAYVGATTEWNKMEGVGYNPADNRLYIAMSNIDRGMRSSTTFADVNYTRDDIQIQKNSCGGTYELVLGAGVKDTNGSDINSSHVATRMFLPTRLAGEEISRDALSNTCNPDKIANTDNVFFSQKMRTLFIGEDSGTHVNNFVWAYNVDTGKLSRILSTIAGSEATGLQVLDNEGGHAYIMSNTQHHGDWKFENITDTTIDQAVLGAIKKVDAGDFGYLEGIPGL